MTELEERLYGSDRIAVIDATLARLDQIAARIAAFQRSGPSPVDYARATTIGNAVAAARDVVTGAHPAR
ncbi:MULTISPECIES: EscE/YscE/SsaE family type III secretion system needle protein co-chaperone [Bradyrhizobium]|uniref:EscE/YscE/SsaE family type III secretion system needle protein co-chaperone n=1 Tax=Bradyrhizobium TaxID=374 RepID=UPI001BA96514|nr:EscE/YscE/SsaE family type III secretion system needle protein co-chaperone [Bradyrhizobium liaoningense]MBR0988375.1 hypothetical protein [Bradyrhizobium liaoningense]